MMGNASCQVMLDTFSRSLPATSLLQCADAAVLLVGNMDNCGKARLDSTHHCNTFSVIQKGCATGAGYYRYSPVFSDIVTCLKFNSY